MLREGQPLLHYSSKGEISDEQFDKAMLSSGFLSALASFSQEARSSDMDNFSSGNELFVFTKVPELDVIVIGSFTKNISVAFARMIINHLNNLLKGRNVIEMSGIYDLHRPQKLDFIRSIPDYINQVLLTEYSEDYFNGVANECHGANLAFVIELDSKNVIWKYARPSPLFNPSLKQDTLLINRFAVNLVSKLGLGNQYLYLTASTGNYSIAIQHNDHMITYIQSPVAPVEDVLTAVSKLAYQSASNPSALVLDEKNIQNYQLTEMKLIRDSSSTGIWESNKGIFFHTYINAINKLFEQTLNRKPDKFQIIVSTTPLITFRITVNPTNRQYYIKFHGQTPED